MCATAVVLTNQWCPLAFITSALLLCLHVTTVFTSIQGGVGDIVQHFGRNKPICFVSHSGERSSVSCLCGEHGTGIRVWIFCIKKDAQNSDIWMFYLLLLSLHDLKWGMVVLHRGTGSQQAGADPRWHWEALDSSSHSRHTETTMQTHIYTYGQF